MICWKNYLSIIAVGIGILTFRGLFLRLSSFIDDESRIIFFLVLASIFLTVVGLQSEDKLFSIPMLPITFIGVLGLGMVIFSVTKTSFMKNSDETRTIFQNQFSTILTASITFTICIWVIHNHGIKSCG